VVKKSKEALIDTAWVLEKRFVCVAKPYSSAVKLLETVFST